MRNEKFKITPQMFLNLSLICYMCCNVVRLVIYRFTHFVDFSYTITYFFIYGFLLIYLYRSKRWFTKATMLIIVFMLIFLGMTCLLHQEYIPLFFGKSSDWRTNQIITKQVFAMASGFTILPIICLYSEPEDFMKSMTIVAIVNSIYYIFLYLTNNFSTTQSTITSNDTYSGSMGYYSLIPLFILSYNVIKGTKLVNRIISGFISIIMFWMVLTSGVRGPLLCIVIFCFMYLMFGIDYKFKKTAKIGITLLSVVLGYFCMSSDFLIQIGLFLSRLGIKSRSINALINGIISDDNGRNMIKYKAYSLISEGGVLGSGFCSSRYYYFGSYPHNIFLEVLIDMGYIGGSIFIILLLIGVIKFFIYVQNFKWRYAFITLFSCALGKLLVSASLWSDTNFWGTVAIGIAAVKYSNIKKEINISTSYKRIKPT